MVLKVLAPRWTKAVSTRKPRPGKENHLDHQFSSGVFVFSFKELVSHGLFVFRPAIGSHTLDSLVTSYEKPA